MLIMKKERLHSCRHHRDPNDPNFHYHLPHNYHHHLHHPSCQASSTNDSKGGLMMVVPCGHEGANKDLKLSTVLKRAARSPTEVLRSPRIGIASRVPDLKRHQRSQDFRIPSRPRDLNRHQPHPLLMVPECIPWRGCNPTGDLGLGFSCGNGSRQSSPTL